MSDTHGMAYIARRGCGCIVAATADDPGRRSAVARDISRWVKAGYVVERVTGDYVREHMRECRCGLFAAPDGRHE